MSESPAIPPHPDAPRSASRRQLLQAAGLTGVASLMTSAPAGAAETGTGTGPKVLRYALKVAETGFDPAKIQDRATYDNPHQLATGMTHVIVNGKVAWRDGRGTGVRAGVVLRPGT